MGVLKGIGYTLAAILVLAVLLIGGALISSFVLVAGFFLFVAAVVSLIALWIKECCESVPNRTKQSQRAGPKEGA